MTAAEAHPVASGAPAPPRPPHGPAGLAPAAGFVCLPRAVLRAPGLSCLARLLYGVLLDYARQDGACFPGTDRLRADLGCGHNQLARALRELEAAGLVARRRRGFGKTTLYRLLPLPGPRPVRDAPAASPIPAAPLARSAPRPGRPVCPAAGRQTAPVRAAQDREAGDPDAEDQQPPAASPAAPARAPQENGAGVVALLVDQGVTASVAKALAARYDPARIRRQVDCHGHRVTALGLARNPAGALVKAIREDWAPPAAWTVAQERATARDRRAQEEAVAAAEEEARRRAWAARPPEERIAGRLQFWLLQQRAKRREPTEAEVAAKRAELLAELAGLAAPRLAREPRVADGPQSGPGVVTTGAAFVGAVAWRAAGGGRAALAAMPDSSGAWRRLRRWSRSAGGVTGRGSGRGERPAAMGRTLGSVRGDASPPDA